MTPSSLCSLVSIVCIMASAAAPKPTSTRDEMDEARQWAASSFQPVRRAVSNPAQVPGYGAGLVVLANHDRVAQNVRPDGVPIKIGKAVFSRGLLCHAVSKVLVRLPGPGKSFTSVVGIHADAGGGSVIFSVDVPGRTAFRTAVVHCGDDGIPVSVGLSGAKEFTISVSDAGDGITCDQSDWADAKVTLEDGRELWLGDMPILSGRIAEREESTPPFSFIYDGKLSDDLLGSWTFSETSRKLDRNRVQRTQSYTDPTTGLELRCVRIEYNDFPTVEWTIYIRNSGKQDTPIIEDVLPLDTRVTRGDAGEFVLHHNVGTPCTPEDFRPLQTVLSPGEAKRIGAVGGRPMNTDMPYFNLEWGDQGMIVVLGWPGQWTSGFLRDAGTGLRIVGGQEMTRFRLHPGEEVRTPLVVLQFWKGGDVVRSQNIWRRWMTAHSLPRQRGKLLGPVFSAAAADLFPNLIDTEKDEITLIDGYVREKLKVDYWWRDAGWYACGDTWVNTGTWEPDPVRYPNGLRAVADRAHAGGMRFITWFEPERVTAGSWLAEAHPEWVHGGRAGGLLDLGNPDALKWVTDHVDKLITEQGIDMYRQDFNMDPLDYWRANDADDRRGITEIRHVEGLLAYWDELKRRHPDMPFDCCASGGRRDDLEMMRRGVPLSKSDYCAGTTSSQCQLYGIASWLPYFAAGAAASEDLYLLRSNIAPWTAVCWDTRNPKMDYDLLRKYMAEWRAVARYYAGDFYPLTQYSLDESAWMAWQFDVPEKGEGMVQAFRRPQSPDESMVYKLRGLESDVVYELKDFDSPQIRRMTGRELMGNGLPLTIARKPWAAIVTYRKAR